MQFVCAETYKKVPRVSITPRNFWDMRYYALNPCKYYIFCLRYFWDILLRYKELKHTGYDPKDYKLSDAEGATFQPQLFDKRPLFCEWLSELPVDVQKPGKWIELDNPYTYYRLSFPYALNRRKRTLTCPSNQRTIQNPRDWSTTGTWEFLRRGDLLPSECSETIRKTHSLSGGQPEK